MIDFSLHIASDVPDIPTENDFLKWISAVITPHHSDAEIAIRIVDDEESAELNQRFRNKSGPTNVLSFNLGDENILIGDIVICAPVMAREAKEQNKNPFDHFAHITVHACYHLLGYDHENDRDAEEMEQLEIATLAELGFANPYGESAHG